MDESEGEISCQRGEVKLVSSRAQWGTTTWSGVGDGVDGPELAKVQEQIKTILELQIICINCMNVGGLTLPAVVD